MLGGVIAEWKSSECSIVPLLVNVTLTVCPWRTWITGPGTLSPKVQAWYSTPLAIETEASVDSISTSTLSPGVSGGSRASLAFCTGSVDASDSGDTAAAAAPGVGGRTFRLLCKPATRKNTSTAMPNNAGPCTRQKTARTVAGRMSLRHSETRRQAGHAFSMLKSRLYG